MSILTEIQKKAILRQLKKSAEKKLTEAKLKFTEINSVEFDFSLSRLHVIYLDQQGRKQIGVTPMTEENKENITDFIRGIGELSEEQIKNTVHISALFLEKKFKYFTNN